MKCDSPCAPAAPAAPAVLAVTALIALSAMLASACGTEGGSGTDSSTDTGVDDGADCTAAPGEEVDLTGTWAAKAFVLLEMVEHPGTSIHVCDDPPVSIATVTWVLSVGEPAGTSLPYSFRVCGITMPQVTASFADCSLGETLVAYLMTSDALDASLPLVEYTGVAQIEAAERCAAVTMDDLYLKIGIRQDMDRTAPLPGWDVECPGTTALQCVDGFETNVIDSDDDGFPGGTFEISTDPPGLVTGFARATLRHWPNLHGVVRDSTLIDGWLVPTLEYDLVGSEATMAGLGIDTPTVKINLPDFVPTEEGSSMVMRRVDGTNGAPDLSGGTGTVTCADVLAAPWLFE